MRVVATYVGTLATCQKDVHRLLAEACLWSENVTMEGKISVTYV
jgi:hypothetical protein